MIKALPLAVLDVFATGIAYISAAWATGSFETVIGSNDFSHMILLIALINVTVFAVGRMYNSLWQYASIDELLRVFLVTIVASIVSDSASALILGHRMPYRVYVFAWIILFVVCGASRFAIRMYSSRKGWSLFGIKEIGDAPRSLIIGAGETGFFDCQAHAFR